MHKYDISLPGEFWPNYNVNGWMAIQTVITLIKVFLLLSSNQLIACRGAFFTGVGTCLTMVHMAVFTAFLSAGIANISASL